MGDGDAELLPKVVDGLDSSSGFFYSVHEVNSDHDILQQLMTIESSPALLGMLRELEDHGESRLA
jgi:hypothetical protein